MNRRLTAGLWYAAGGMLPGLLFMSPLNITRMKPDWFSHRLDETIWLFVVLPAMAGFLAGAWMGEKFSKSARNTRRSNWVWRGMGTAIVAHAIFSFMWPAWDGALGDKQFRFDFVPILCFGLFFFGWLELIVGGVSGWLLGGYRLGIVTEEAEPARRVPALSLPIRAALAALIVAILFALCLAYYCYAREVLNSMQMRVRD